MAYLVSFGAGLSGTAWVVASEIFPMRTRAAALAQNTFVHWLFNYAVSSTFLSLEDAIGAAGTFSIYASVALVGGLLLLRYLPETMGMRLEETERLFADPYPHALATSPSSKESAALLETGK